MKNRFALLPLIPLLLTSTAYAVVYDGFTILPRQDNHDYPWTTKDWRLEKSNNGIDWTSVSTGIFDGSLIEKKVAFGKQYSRLVRFVSLSGNAAGDYTAMAEFNLTYQGVALDRSKWKASANSFGVAPDGKSYDPGNGKSYDPGKAIDGVADTCWHTNWIDAIIPFPHTITFNTWPIKKQVVFGWDRNPEPDIASYTLMYGGATGNYTTTLNAGTNIEQAVDDMVVGGTYYVAVKATATSGLSSPNSAELVVTVEPTPVIKFIIGNNVTTGNLNSSVYSSPTNTSTWIGNEIADSRGIVLAGPEVGGGTITWWKIGWSNGKIGWSNETELTFAPEAPTLTAVNTQVTANIDDLNVRNKPSGTILSQRPLASVGRIVGEFVNMDGYDWYPVIWDDGAIGWSSGELLNKSIPSNNTLFTMETSNDLSQWNAVQAILKPTIAKEFTRVKIEK